MQVGQLLTFVGRFLIFSTFDDNVPKTKHKLGEPDSYSKLL